MSYIIAITGKGGVGKTTVAGLIIKSLIQNKCTPILAVDADPNSCLDGVLGIKVAKTIGRVREEAGEEAKKGMTTGVAKQQLIEMKIAESLVESDDFDFIAMGRPEGPGCYCYANNVLKSALNEISSNYPYVVLDNEAGLENLSRRIVQKVDLLVMVADSSKRGLETLKRLYDLAIEMDTKFDKLVLVVNRLRNDKLPIDIEKIKSYTKADLVVGFPDDSLLFEYSEAGKNLLSFPNENILVERVNEFLNKIGVFKK